ncbi:unnamed protein product [Lactuca virosa]|uniref:K Homology domain-containing protein n=1 Tax=Lactuca virosa TaxID=75947 RepID=A0AAU9P0U6_9ASTR|nr:unnamed protein product [Lactuca virosa]
MDPNPEKEHFAKAKIEDPNQNPGLLQSLLNPNGVPMDDRCYMKIFEEYGKAQQLAEAIASGEKLDRKVYRIRNKELVKFIDKDFEGMKDINIISEASIGVFADAESNLLNHSFLDLVGTVDEVKLAEELILENVLKTYSSLCYPVILMPQEIYMDHIKIHLHKVCRLLGTYRSNLLRIEKESGAWIKIEQGSFPGVWEWERVVNIFGPHENVNKAKLLIQSVISEQPGELSATEALKEFLHQFKEPSCSELIDHKKSAINDESNKKKKQKVGEPIWDQTFLRIKNSGGGKSEGSSSKQTEGESEEKKKQHEFREPTWNQTFGPVISSPGESSEGSKQTEESGELDKGKQQVLQAEEGGSSLTDEEKQQHLQHKKSEDAGPLSAA